MADYINKESVLSKCADIWDSADETTQTGVDTINAIDKITDFIESLPTADVQTVKRGMWETWGYVFHGIEWKRCSVCGKTADISYTALLEGRIEPATVSSCGCCGAIMMKDGEQNERN